MPYISFSMVLFKVYSHFKALPSKDTVRDFPQVTWGINTLMYSGPSILLPRLADTLSESKSLTFGVNHSHKGIRWPGCDGHSPQQVWTTLSCRLGKRGNWLKNSLKKTWMPGHHEETSHCLGMSKVVLWNLQRPFSNPRWRAMYLRGCHILSTNGLSMSIWWSHCSIRNIDSPFPT